MKKILLSFVITLICPVICFAQAILGYDDLALAKFCDTALASPKLPARGTLLVTFGDPLPCLSKLVTAHSLKAVRIHGLNATCHRNKNCERADSASPTDVNVAGQRARLVHNWMQKFPNLDVYYSPLLEGDVQSSSQIKAVFDAAKKNCPKCILVQSRNSGAVMPGVLYEGHGNSAKGDIISNDGASILDSNSIEYVKGAKKIAFGWYHGDNCRVQQDKDNSFTPAKVIKVPPSKRNCCATVKQKEHVYSVLIPPTPAPEFPAFCQKKRTIKAPEINKPAAETYMPCPNSDSRGMKQLYISTITGKRGDKLDIVDVKGNRIGQFCNYGVYEKGPRHRWYVGDCGSKDWPADLKRKANGEWAFIKRTVTEKGKRLVECTRLNLVRREGNYRD